MSPGTLKFVKSGLDAFLSIPTKTERKEKNAEKKGETCTQTLDKRSMMYMVFVLC